MKRFFVQSDEVKRHFLKQYPDTKVEVVDLTGTNNHYRIIISSGHLQGMPRVAAHRLVMGVFDAQLKSGEIHALTIDFKKDE